MRSMKGNRRRAVRSTWRAPSRSCTSAGWTTTLNRRPSVSTRRWRLRPVTFLPASKPWGRAQSPFLSGLGALAVDDRRTWAGFASGLFTRRYVERVVDAHQRAVPFPQHEVIVRCTLRRQVLRQSLPLAASRQHVADRVQHLADIHVPRPAAMLGRWN